MLYCNPVINPINELKHWSVKSQTSHRDAFLAGKIGKSGRSLACRLNLTPPNNGAPDETSRSPIYNREMNLRFNSEEPRTETCYGTRHLYSLTHGEMFWVTRAKVNMQDEIVGEHTAIGAGNKAMLMHRSFPATTLNIQRYSPMKGCLLSAAVRWQVWTAQLACEFLKTFSRPSTEVTGMSWSPVRNVKKKR